MKVAIAGAHGQIALRLARLLAAAGDRVIGLIRNPGHATEVSRAGAAPVLCDLERASVEEITGAIMGADAVVFAAGAGSGSGAGRKLTMDRDGAIKLLRAATAAGILRYLMISGAGVENPPDGDGVFEVYLRAKAEADAALEASDRDWTILRPGGLTNDAGTGKVRIGSVRSADRCHVMTSRGCSPACWPMREASAASCTSAPARRRSSRLSTRYSAVQGELTCPAGRETPVIKSAVK